MIEIGEHARGLTLRVVVQPRASQNKISGELDGALKIRLTAPPVAGAANKACLKLLAKCLKVPPTSLTVLSGHTGRAKRILWQPDDDTPAPAQKRHFQKLLMAHLSKTP